jgi:hypothetical protein
VISSGGDDDHFQMRDNPDSLIGVAEGKENIIRSQQAC